MQIPPILVTLLAPFVHLFTAPAFKKAQQLCLGAILCQGARTISNILRALGLDQEARFDKYHRFLSRDRYCLRAASLVLLKTILSTFFKNTSFQKVFVIVDEHLERRHSTRLIRSGRYRDPIRSKGNKNVSSTGFKWFVGAILVELPWATRPWSLPFITFLMNSKQHDEQNNHRHRTLKDYLKILCRTLRKSGEYLFYIIGDGAYATFENVKIVTDSGYHLISRLRLDARLYEEPDNKQGKRGRKAQKGKRIASFKDMTISPEEWENAEVNWYGGEKKQVRYKSGIALMYKAGQGTMRVKWVLVEALEGRKVIFPLLSTDRAITAVEIIEAYVTRFSIEVSFEESRAHIGIETQRQSSEQAIVRSTPLLFGLFSFVVLLGRELHSQGKIKAHNAASWYKKEDDELTFSDIIACVRRYCWSEKYLVNSGEEAEMTESSSEITRILIERLSRSAA